MMKTCELCERWAQWRMYTVEAQEEKKEFAMIGGVRKPLAPRGPQLVPGPVLCQVHKQEMEQTPSDGARRFSFAGSFRA